MKRRVLGDNPTNRDIINYVDWFLDQQGKKSLGTNSGGLMTCKYRGPNGLRCAVGCLLTEEELDDIEEGKSATGNFNNRKLPFRLFPLVDLLDGAQSVHDDCSVLDWKQEMQTLREQWS